VCFSVFKLVYISGVFALHSPRCLVVIDEALSYEMVVCVWVQDLAMIGEKKEGEASEEEESDDDEDAEGENGDEKEAEGEQEGKASPAQRRKVIEEIGGHDEPSEAKAMDEEERSIVE
jgi:hypothetical protein